MAIQGYIHPGSGDANLRPRDISLDPTFITSFTPLIYELALRDPKGAIDNVYNWAERDHVSAINKIDNVGGYSAGATTLKIDDASIVNINDQIRNERTKEIYWVTARSTGANTIDVVRNIGGTGAAAINNDDDLLNLGGAFEAASSSPDSIQSSNVRGYNYLQIFRQTFLISGDSLRMNPQAMLDYGDDARMKMEQQLRDIEHSFIFGKRHLDTITKTTPAYMTGGLESFITTNVEPAGGTIDEDEWNEFLADKAFYNGSQQKVAICGRNYFKALSKWARGAYTLQTMGTALRDVAGGVNVSLYVSPTGQELLLYNHELFKQTTELAGMCIVIDPEKIRLRYAERNQGGPTPANFDYPTGKMLLVEDTQTRGVDGFRAEYFAQIGLEMRDETSFAIMTGMTGPT